LIEETDMMFQSDAMKKKNIHDARRRKLSCSFTETDDETDYFQPGIGGSNALLLGPTE
jgi:hypothetical protein